MTLSGGSRLGPYEIVGRLGAGGMGEVCLGLGFSPQLQLIEILSRDLSIAQAVERTTSQCCGQI